MSSRTSALRRCLDQAKRRAAGSGSDSRSSSWGDRHALQPVSASSRQSSDPSPPRPRLYRGVSTIVGARSDGGLHGERWTVASHGAAARLLGLGIEWAPVEMLRTTRTRAPAPIGAHHTDTLEPVDTSRAQGIPVTSPARTLIDLGAGPSTRCGGRLRSRFASAPHLCVAVDRSTRCARQARPAGDRNHR